MSQLHTEQPDANGQPAAKAPGWTLASDASERMALLGVVVNTGLTAIKLTAGLLGHSFALVADAVESMADIAGSLVIWGGLKYGAREPDDEHPYGHGKAEALAALGVAGLILVAALGIAAQSIYYILTPHMHPRPFTLIVLVAVIVTKEWLHFKAKRAAKASGSCAGQADAFHHRSDAITSAAAFIGIAIALAGGPGWAPADDWAALFASGIIAFNGLMLSREPFGELMDQHLPEVAEQCTDIVTNIEGVDRVERCNARKAGRQYRLMMHMEVDPNMSVFDAHRLTGIAKEQVRQQIPEVASLEIHIEPTTPGSGISE